MSKITVDGNTATTLVAYHLSEAATIYPITPSSTMAELADSMANDGVKNIFGNTLKVVEMQSEAGAAGALHGALSGGALATTFTASQGLLLMVPNMYKIAGELLPCVMHVSARSLATHALSIFGDHSDVMACRQTGFAMLASGSVQEAHDLALVAHIATLNSSVPFMHFFDGFRTSHEINTIEQINLEKIKEIYPFEKVSEFKKRALNSSTPHQQGTAQNPDIFFQNREACNSHYNLVPTIVEKAMEDFYRLFGRKYALFDYCGDKNATDVIILMGSGANTAETTINYLNKTKGTKYGVLKVRLFRPFNAQALVKALPKTVKRIAVLDRTKEPGSIGEPLYQDVVTALSEMGIGAKVIGGRYGLGSKEFTPSMVGAVFENLESKKPINHFTVGIDDDVTNLSLKINNIIHPTDNNVTACKFYGYGGDGTVSANKSSIKIIGNNTTLNGQAYFEYDSKKSGNATISHLRFGKDEINESYLLDNIDFVAVHNQTYIKKYNILKGLKQNGTLLLNTQYNLNELEILMPASLKRDIANLNINFYTIDAYSIAKELGLGNKINLIMQSAFFKLINILPFETAKSEMKKMAEKSYGHKGEKVLNSNFKAIESAEDKINKINYPSTWKTANETCATCTKKCTKYYEEFVSPIEKLEGDKLPVSAFTPNGNVPTGTSQYEKRGIATMLPCWNSDKCIQCNMCAFACPHAVIRPKLIDEKDLVNAPDTLKVLNAIAEPGKKFVLDFSPLDCTGCGVCESVCPTKGKALSMLDATNQLEIETKNHEYLENIKIVKSNLFKNNTVKGVGFEKPYFEFSGACAGCGETPYLKVISQLYGDHMVIANATGCSSIYGGSAPTCPYTFDENGGPAWANSLFEDNAEFGYGIKLGLKVKQEQLKTYLNDVLNDKFSENVKTLINEYLTKTTTNEQRDLRTQILKALNLESKINPTLVKQIENLSDAFINQSLWIVGGDGWAYDIGYGGLDHVLASGENVNILVLDTEVYSNTGGQASKSTPTGAVAKFASGGKTRPKKDLALIATMYKDVYVAKVSMGADMNHFLKCVREAEAYDGVSLIIAYSPCINHGINMSDSQLEQKKAVECGYWNLWHYNPTLLENGENPYVLDSGEPTKDYIEFLQGETRYSALLKKNPEKATELFEKAKRDAKERFEDIKQFSNTNEKEQD
ncbi:MAG: pyruvate:ferredoxin (flavodoxin) oxidoreductase [Clostridia bacterium]|nr:pyruvate:ferredoxin (flavodoxin) oxidoreductase [Clostridia bacterium]